MKRRFIDAPSWIRCKESVKLKDGSIAQCGRYQKIHGYCRQHYRILFPQSKYRE